MAVVRWTFSDPVTLEVYEFELNPSEATEPQYEKAMTYEKTAGQNGQVLAYEGRREPQRLTWKGAILDNDEHEVFKEWFEKNYQIDVTDDLGQEFRVYITKYAPERKRAVMHPYKRMYSIEALVIDT